MGFASLKSVFYAVVAVGAVEPNPPVWPASVQVFGPESSTNDINSAVQDAFTTNGGSDEHGQFSSSRFAFLFKPGSYDVDVPVGYYTQVAGLGAKPSDVIFTSSKGVYCQEASFTVSPGALDTFWRSAENFQTNADYSWNGDGSYGMLWAASQASPTRSIVVSNDLTLYQYTGGNAAGYSSGGFMSNMLVNGSVKFGSQQQYLTRSSTLANVEDGVWNMVFVGAEGAPGSHCGADNKLCIHPYVTVDETTVSAEKPFIVIDDQGLYSLRVPLVQFQSRGHIHELETRTVGFESVYVASADVDTADSINAKLADGLDVVLAPGIYNLSSPLQITAANQVLLGLGLATLSPTNGTAVIQVANVPGVRVAGLLIQAGSEPTEALLEWGDGAYAGDASNPGSLHDVFMRVGGPTVPVNAQTKIMLRINSGTTSGFGGRFVSRVVA